MVQIVSVAGFLRALAPHPSLRRHKPSALGVVALDGKDIYLGHWPDSQKRPPAAGHGADFFIDSQHLRPVAQAFIANIFVLAVRGAPGSRPVPARRTRGGTLL